jgi:diaminohydroxyphosphoribosylaminopyrimidine deaminase/5-amino-6-(5-phosphoribosylamino)uracil reductase
MEDPYPLVRGRGFAVLRERGVAVEVGVEGEAAARLNQPFLTALRAGRPYVILKAATTADGFLGAPGRRTPLTSRAAIRHAHMVRAQVDAVAIGSETLLIDDPLLTVREVYRDRPLTRIVLDRRLRTPAGARLLSTLEAGPVIILTSTHAVSTRAARVRELERAGASIITADGPDLTAAMRRLGRQGIQSLLLEGGAIVQTAAWNEAIVDCVQLYVSPVSLPGGGSRIPEASGFSIAALREVQVTPLGPDVLIEGYVHRPH